MSECKPLSGIKVLDLTQFEAGPVCTEILAWLGAEVWKVERPEKGELNRFESGIPGKVSLSFLLMNMNKKSITCNMKNPEGHSLMMKMVEQADILVENMGPGSIDKLGLGYDKVSAANPRLIFAQIKGFGQDGPYRGYPAFNPIGAAMGGLVALNGERDGPPMQCGVSVADSGTGIMCATSIMAALLQREKTGHGQQIEVAMQDFMITLARGNWEPYYRFGKPPSRVGNDMPLEDVGPNNLYPCKPFGPNDYVHIYCSRNVASRHFADLCKAIEREDLLEDERFATPQSRFTYKHVLDPIISEWTGRHTKREAMDIICGHDIPAGAVMDCDDFVNEPYFQQNGTLTRIDFEDKEYILPGFAPKMTGLHVDYETCPDLGEHNGYVYGDVLGLSEAEQSRLAGKGVI